MAGETDWQPVVEISAGSHFKWGFDGQTGQFTIWEVSLVGDGLPTHDTYLNAAWGRSPQPPHDRLGTAAVEEDVVNFVVYYNARLPRKAETWARQHFPQRTIVSVRVGVNES
jgi:hypothetical protein